MPVVTELYSRAISCVSKESDIKNSFSSMGSVYTLLGSYCSEKAYCSWRKALANVFFRVGFPEQWSRSVSLTEFTPAIMQIFLQEFNIGQYCTAQSFNALLCVNVNIISNSYQVLNLFFVVLIACHLIRLRFLKMKVRVCPSKVSTKKLRVTLISSHIGSKDRRFMVSCTESCNVDVVYIDFSTAFDSIVFLANCSLYLSTMVLMVNY